MKKSCFREKENFSQEQLFLFQNAYFIVLSERNAYFIEERKKTVDRGIEPLFPP